MPLWLLITLISVAAVAAVTVIGAVIYKVNKSNGKDTGKKNKDGKENVKEKENEKEQEKSQSQEKTKDNKQAVAQETITAIVNGKKTEIPVETINGVRYAKFKGKVNVAQVQDLLLAQQNNAIAELNVVQQKNLDANRALLTAKENAEKSNSDLEKQKKEVDDMAQLSGLSQKITTLVNSLPNSVEIPTSKLPENSAKEVKKGPAELNTEVINKKKKEESLSK